VVERGVDGLNGLPNQIGNRQTLSQAAQELTSQSLLRGHGLRFPFRAREVGASPTPAPRARGGAKSLLHTFPRACYGTGVATVGVPAVVNSSSATIPN
jgi:hypothetical protein